MRCCLLLFAARSVHHALGAVGIVLGLACLAPAGAEGLPLNSVVRFNTVCANCHEAQCSGRLAFGSGAEAARGHMERYLGPLTDDEVGFLFRILGHTKAHCAHYPVAERVPSDLVWTEADLEPWRNAQEGGYFIPLGQLDAGRYRLEMVLAATLRFRLKISDDGFEPVVEEVFCVHEPTAIEFELDGASRYYLTLGGEKALEVLQLSFEKR